MKRLVLLSISFCATQVFAATPAQPIQRRASRQPRETIFRAAALGDIAKINEYLKKGVSVNVKDVAGRTPLIYAVKRSMLGSITTLIRADANVMIADKSGNTALHYAAQNGDLLVLKLLLENVKDKKGFILLKNKGNRTALDFAKLRKNALFVVELEKVL